jgi:hypothetical protein
MVTFDAPLPVVFFGDAGLVEDLRDMVLLPGAFEDGFLVDLDAFAAGFFAAFFAAFFAGFLAGFFAGFFAVFTDFFAAFFTGFFAAFFAGFFAGFFAAFFADVPPAFLAAGFLPVFFLPEAFFAICLSLSPSAGAVPEK